MADVLSTKGKFKKNDYTLAWTGFLKREGSVSSFFSFRLSPLCYGFKFSSHTVKIRIDMFSHGAHLS